MRIQIFDGAVSEEDPEGCSDGRTLLDHTDTSGCEQAGLAAPLDERRNQLRPTPGSSSAGFRLTAMNTSISSIFVDGASGFRIMAELLSWKIPVKSGLPDFGYMMASGFGMNTTSQPVRCGMFSSGEDSLAIQSARCQYALAEARPRGRKTAVGQWANLRR
jgi:hypothetical protein